MHRPLAHLNPSRRAHSTLKPLARFNRNRCVRVVTSVLAALVSWLSIAAQVLGQDQPKSVSTANAAGIEFFERKVRPILVDHCYECHGKDPTQLEGGLSVLSREDLLRGGDSGPAIISGQPSKSLLIGALNGAFKDLQMPPKPAERLTASQIADLEAWIRMGAPDPRQSMALAKLGSPQIRPKYGMSLEEGRKFWSFQPIGTPSIPSVQDQTWPRNDIDRFILTRLESQSLAPAPDADKRTILRRVTYDLTGLPPTYAEYESFLADTSPEAFDRVVDRLLDSPAYGERWGRHWLDVVRYADTSGNASDYPVPQAHRYRNWVIRAIQQDMPYDKFLREQIAGDLLGGEDESQRYERIVATGYLAISRRFGGSRFGEHHLTIEDTIDNVGRAILGQSLSCARCHDHKFDPFTMNDYYGLYGIFESTRYPFPGAEAAKNPEDFVPLMSAEQIEALLKPHREQLATLDAEVKSLEAKLAEAKKAPDGAEKTAAVDAATKALADANKRRTDLRNQAPRIEDAYAVADAKPVNAKIQLRGDPQRTGDEVPRHFPTILGGHSLPAGDSTSGRLQLASWITDPANPLTARVMVNRIWQYHFGSGIVATPNDFGRQGKAPTHPELLDYLARQFIESNWSIKKMHKLILGSRTWQQASIDQGDSLARDPANELYSRAERRRLDAEQIRDSLLLIGGGLDSPPSGPHPFPPRHAWGFTQHNPFFATYETRSRSVYLMQQRLRKHPYLALFDGADPSSSTAVRLPSTTPLQALFTLNGTLAHEESAKFAQRIASAASDDQGRINWAYRTAYTRDPTSDELAECATFLSTYRERLASVKVPAGEIEQRTWSALSRALLGANEFVYID